MFRAEKGLMDKKQRKMVFLKGKTKGKPKRKQNRKKLLILKTGLSGEQNRKKTFKIAGT